MLGMRYEKRCIPEPTKRMMNHSKVAEDLLNDFLQHVRALGGNVEPVKVLRSNTYRVGNSHVLARVAADTGKYFFGLNYINAEEVANLDNPFIAFVCGDVGSSVIMPMSELMELLPQISHDRNGEFKINITKDFQLALKGRGNRKPLGEFLNKWDAIASPSAAANEVTPAEQSFHTVDGEDNFLQMKDRNVFFYVCCECDRQISYEEFIPAAAARTSHAE
jgi:hypothetical protein